MEADINGPQRKVVYWSVRPARAAQGDSGIPLQEGVVLPFVVSRSWNAPAGYYLEQWFLIHPQTREVLYEGPKRQALIWGLQSWTEITDEVPGGFPLAPGTYQIVFALGGMQGGTADVEASEAPAEAA
jgi:hypothetical protein